MAGTGLNINDDKGEMAGTGPNINDDEGQIADTRSTITSDEGEVAGTGPNNNDDEGKMTDAGSIFMDVSPMPFFTIVHHLSMSSPSSVPPYIVSWLYNTGQANRQTGAGHMSTTVANIYHTQTIDIVNAHSTDVFSLPSGLSVTPKPGVVLLAATFLTNILAPRRFFTLTG